MNGDVEESVFLNTWIPSSLHQISDLSIMEKDLRPGGAKDCSEMIAQYLLNCSVMKGRAQSPKVVEEGDHNVGKENVPPPNACVDVEPVDVTNAAVEDWSGAEEAESSESTCSCSDDDGEETKKMSYINGNFTGAIPDGMDRKVWKKLVKEENRQKRKSK
eukprot:CAMPEP_0113855374 /NCGR_PEP_ID=MMETSP0372-20130328/8171_1 /TAXON_ID=340204 /ORGANISM="Lankesteria abbotti" /LENGTH=159 /DNA_ID=CAMNT_0000829309 /DNA_START=71 /DNA_END=547 /DNA_ORIENTATION=- /assembly_acc=CAM_ASM_000359